VCSRCSLFGRERLCIGLVLSHGSLVSHSRHRVVKNVELGASCSIGSPYHDNTKNLLHEFAQNKQNSQ
jgi:hypothetical protein